MYKSRFDYNLQVIKGKPGNHYSIKQLQAIATCQIQRNKKDACELCR